MFHKQKDIKLSAIGSEKASVGRVCAIDLFCGAGGLTRGLLDSGIDVIAGFDIDTGAKSSYEENNIRFNGEKSKYICQSVTTLTKRDILNLIGTKAQRKKENTKFLLAGCAPCQPFSTRNKNRGDKSDDRRTLITYFANLINATEPDFVLMENVAGLEKFEKENFKYFTDILDSKNYKWDRKIVNAVNYGVPQNRKRFVLLASRVNEISIPQGKYDGEIKPFATVADAIRDLAPIEAGECHATIPNHKSANLVEINKERAKYKNRRDWPNELWLDCHKGLLSPSEHSDVYGKLSWHKPAPTLTTKFYSISNGRFGHPEQIRALSLREGALLQSFPPSYVFYGLSTVSIARQIGNAVPPKMAKAFGKYLLGTVSS